MISPVSALTALEKVAKTHGTDITKDMEALAKNIYTPKSKLTFVTGEWLKMIPEHAMNEMHFVIKEWVRRNTDQFEIICITAVQLSSDQKDDITQQLRAKYSQKVIFKVNAKILGGVQFVFPCYIIDNSIAQAIDKYSKVVNSK